MGGMNQMYTTMQNTGILQLTTKVDTKRTLTMMTHIIMVRIIARTRMDLTTRKYSKNLIIPTPILQSFPSKYLRQSQMENIIIITTSTPTKFKVSDIMKSEKNVTETHLT